MDIDELKGQLEELATELLEDAVGQFTAKECGLDKRASCYTLWVSDTWIACVASQDRNLQYYGGFEYVDKGFRQELGDYVIYFADDARVQAHIDIALGHTDEDE